MSNFKITIFYVIENKVNRKKKRKKKKRRVLTIYYWLWLVKRSGGRHVDTHVENINSDYTNSREDSLTFSSSNYQ